MFKLNLKTINLQKYDNFQNKVLKRDQTVENINYKVKYNDTQNLKEINKLKLRQLQFDQDLISNPNITYVIDLQDDVNKQPLEEQQIQMFKNTTENRKKYLETISENFVAKMPMKT
jgi:hypothetical protein